MRLNVDLSVNDYDRELFGERRIVLELRDGESMQHIVLKILAMALFHDAALLIEPRMDDDERFAPDLLIRGEDGRTRVWIECGACRVQKLDKVTFRHYDARVVVIKRYEREAREMLERCRGEVRRLQAVEFIGFDSGFVDQVADTLTGKNDVIAILSGDRVQLVISGTTFESRVHRYSG